MKKALTLSAFVGVAVLYACGTETISNSERDSTVTVYDPDRTYSTSLSYSLSEVIVDICFDPDAPDPGVGGAGGESGEEEQPEGCTPWDTEGDEDILKTVEANMKAYGYSQKTWGDEDADLTLLVGRTARSGVSWNLGLSYCYPDYYRSGCIVPLSKDEVYFPKGTLVMQLVDNRASTDTTLITAWTAVVDKAQETAARRAGGNLGGSTGQADDLVIAGINQAFLQSPYLRGGTAQ